MKVDYHQRHHHQQHDADQSIYKISLYRYHDHLHHHDDDDDGHYDDYKDLDDDDDLADQDDDDEVNLENEELKASVGEGQKSKNQERS